MSGHGVETVPTVPIHVSAVPCVAQLNHSMPSDACSCPASILSISAPPAIERDREAERTKSYGTFVLWSCGKGKSIDSTEETGGCSKRSRSALTVMKERFQRLKSGNHKGDGKVIKPNNEFRTRSL